MRLAVLQLWNASRWAFGALHPRKSDPGQQLVDTWKPRHVTRNGRLAVQDLTPSIGDDDFGSKQPVHGVRRYDDGRLRFLELGTTGLQL